MVCFSYQFYQQRLSRSGEIFYDAQSTISRRERRKSKSKPGGHRRSLSFARAFARVRDTFKTIDDEFECPICFEEMCPPTKIFQCGQGHVVCEVGLL